MSKRMLNILIVDDSPVMAQTAWRVIRHNLLGLIPLSIKMVDSAEKGIDLFKKNRFEVLISDVQMKEMGGFAFLQHMIKLDAKFSDKVFCILMSGNIPDVYFTEAKKLGAMFCPKDEINKIVAMIKSRFNIG